MKAIIISYDASKLSKTEASKLSKKLFGYQDKSNRGKYTYHRKGEVSKQPFIRFTRGLFAVPKEKAHRLLSVIKNSNAQWKLWEADINKRYFK